MNLDHDADQVRARLVETAGEAYRQKHWAKAARAIREALSLLWSGDSEGMNIVDTANRIAEACLLEGQYPLAAAIYRDILTSTRSSPADGYRPDSVQHRLAVALWLSGGLTPGLFFGAHS